MRGLLILSACVVLATAQTVNYCDTSLCPKGATHIACDNTLDWNPTCISPQQVRISDYIGIIVSIHNQFREVMADGQMHGYGPMPRMASISWDNELSAMAEFSVRRCELLSDQCHNTDTYRNSGQNSGSFHMPTDSIVLITPGIQTLMKNWWFQSKPNFKNMADEFQTKIGCAGAIHKNPAYTFLLICNYATVGRSEFRKGIVASECAQKDTTFPHLCSSDEVYKFCYSDLCAGGVTHVACQKKGMFGPSCSEQQMVTLTEHYIDLILDLHNSFRNLIASGQVSGYKPAKQMATIQWDPDMAAIAEYNVKNCDETSDECHNTILYRHSGQIIGTATFSGSADYDSLISSIINAWKGNSENMAVMASQYQLAVGCAAITYRTSKPTFQITCNYAISANHIFDAVFACENMNRDYANLCSTDEVYPDYCDPTLCPDGVTHIACNNDGAFNSEYCSNGEPLSLEGYKNLIVDEHNKNRIEAELELGDFQWDNELAALAAYSVRRCDYEFRDACHSTKTLSDCGQIEYSSFFDNWSDFDLIARKVEFENTLKNIINGWFLTNHQDVYPRMPKEQKIFVGCTAASPHRTGHRHITFQIYCNYGISATNPSYTTSTAGSE